MIVKHLFLITLSLLNDGIIASFWVYFPGPVFCLFNHDKGLSQWEKILHIDSLVQDFGNSIAKAREFRQSCPESLICSTF